MVLKLQLASSAVKYLPCPKDAHSSSRDTTVVFGKWRKAARLLFHLVPPARGAGWLKPGSATAVTPPSAFQCLYLAFATA